MGKKNRNKTNKQEKYSKKKNKFEIPYTMIAVTIFIGLVVFMAYKGIGKSIDPEWEKSYQLKTANMNLKETRTVLPPSFYSGKVAYAYELASKIPDILDKQYCYCDCSKNPRFNHKSLLTCFTEDHGSKCGICMNEVFASYEYYRKGLPVEEITKNIDREFSRLRH